MKTAPITLDPQNLPDDLLLLKSLIADLVTALKNKEADNDKLRHQLHEALRRHYGRKSETISSDQMALFQKLIEEQLAKVPKLPQSDVAEKVAVRGHGRRKPPKDLPKKVEPYPLPEDKKSCPDCNLLLEKIGEEVRSLIDYIPASVFVREQTAEKWACGSCQGKVVTSELPAQPIDRCMAGEGLLAQVITAKYSDHIPLYRQAEIFARQGFDVNRSTLCGWTAQVAELLKPLVDAMKADILESKVLHSDDTPVPVLEDDHASRRPNPPPEGADASADDPLGRRKARQGRLWTWVGDKNHSHTVFDYTPDRKGVWPQDFLIGWKGFLQADAYAGYDELYKKRGVIEVACWAHARRKFFECQDTDRNRALTAIAYIRNLYDVEDGAKGLPAVECRSLRQKHSKPVLDEFKIWLDTQNLVVLPKSAMGEAIGYALRQWTALNNYLDDGDLAIDNNAAENALRCVALGRKNWLFAGSDAGGQRAAVLYSLVASCKRHKIDPFAYLRDVISRISAHRASKIHELLPVSWAASNIAKNLA